MVHLFEIKYDKGKLSCKYTAESSKSEGYVVYDIESGTFPVEKKSLYDRDKKVYLYYVERGLRDIAEHGPPYAQEHSIMWY